MSSFVIGFRVRMSVLAICCAALGFIQGSVCGQAPSDSKNYFALLLTAKSAGDLKPEALQTMQGEHLSNFAQLGKVGKLQVAGPCNDPEKKVRGILVLKGASDADVQKYFAADPFVQQGYMQVALFEQQELFGRVLSVPDEAAVKSGSIELEESLLVLFDASDKWKAATPAQQAAAFGNYREWLSKLPAGNALGWASWMKSSTELKSAWLVRGMDKSSAETLAANCPLVQEKWLTVRILPQYLLKGALAPKP